MLSRFSPVRLCNPMDCSLPGSSVHGILQARILEWVAMPSSRGSSLPRVQTRLCLVSLALASGFLTTSATWEALITAGIHLFPITPIVLIFGSDGGSFPPLVRFASQGTHSFPGVSCSQ